MSLNPVPLKLYRCEDPVTKVGNEREYSVLKGGQEVFYYPFPTSGQPNTSINTINCNPTNQRTIIDRKIYVKATFVLNFSGTGATGGLLQAGYDAPRAYPIAMVTKNLSIQLGDQTISTNLNEYFSAVERYNATMWLEDHEYSMSPTMPDQYQNYSEGVLSNNSELTNYHSNPAQVPRGFFPGSTGNVWYNISQIGVSGATAATASVLMTVTEPLFLSPLYFGKGEHSGFIGIQNMQVQIQFGDLSRLWSHSTSSPSVISFPTGLNVTVQNLQILVKQVTPDALQKIPNIIPYPYSQITSFPSGTVYPVASQAQQVMNSGSITLNSIPTRMYFYARQQNSDLTATSPDTFAVLQQITIQLGTRQLLSSATQQDLYQISVRNGVNLSWTQWADKVGSVLAVDLSKDLGLQPSEAPGLLTRSSLVVNATFLNTNANSVNYIFYVLICEEGTVTIDNGHMLKSVGVLTQADILAAENAPIIPYKNDRNIYGGAWYNDLWEGIKSGAKFIKDDVLPIAKDVLPILAGLGNTGGKRKKMKGGDADMRDYEMNDEYVADCIEGGKRKRGRPRKAGKGLVGGRMMSRYDL